MKYIAVDSDFFFFLPHVSHNKPSCKVSSTQAGFGMTYLKLHCVRPLIEVHFSHLTNKIFLTCNVVSIVCVCLVVVTIYVYSIFNNIKAVQPTFCL